MSYPGVLKELSHLLATLNTEVQHGYSMSVPEAAQRTGCVWLHQTSCQLLLTVRLTQLDIKNRVDA